VSTLISGCPVLIRTSRFAGIIVLFHLVICKPWADNSSSKIFAANKEAFEHLRHDSQGH